jgi:hypothetical protein
MYALFWYSCGLWPPATTTQQASLAAATGCPPSAQRLDANYSASMPDLEKC